MAIFSDYLKFSKMSCAERILLVGAGMTTASTAFLLRKTNCAVELFCWEKSSHPGGRMSTVGSSTISGLCADLGAQDISPTERYQERHKEFYENMLSDGIITPMTVHINGEKVKGGPIRNYVAKNGMKSIVKYFLDQSYLKPCYNRKIMTLHAMKDVTLKDVWCATDDSGIREYFDLVILTIPVPQVLDLEIEPNLPLDLMHDMKVVEYSSRFALALFYDCKLTLDWKMKYVYNSESIRFLSVDTEKRCESHHGTSVVVHTSVPFSMRHLKEEQGHVTRLILQELKALVPELPKATETVCHLWRYSQVCKGYPSSFGCVVSHEKPPLILAGDAFTHSHIDGCIEAALRTCENIRSRK